MFKRIVQWVKDFFQSLFGGKSTSVKPATNLERKAPPPLNDTDLEFLFTELIAGVYQSRGQAWALKWLQNIEHRVSTERWVEWLKQFGNKLLASAAPNNEMASRLLGLGELEIGEVGDVAYDIGMQLLARNQPDPIIEYVGPDTEPDAEPNNTVPITTAETEASPDGEFQTITLDQLLTLMQKDENLRQLVAQQVGIETDDPDMIIQALVAQHEAANQVSDASAQEE
jgi:hypothetical protein